MGDLFATFPLPLIMCVAWMTGQQVVDSLTLGCKALPKECGGIHHVSANLAYTIVLTTPPTVKDVLYQGEPIALDRKFKVTFPSSVLNPKFGAPASKLPASEIIVQEEYGQKLQDICLMYCDRHKDDPSKNPANPTVGRIKIVQP